MKRTNKEMSKANDSAVTKSDLQGAHYTKMLVSSAIEAIQKITPQAVGYDPLAFSKINAFIEWLNGFISQSNAVIDRGNKQYGNRPQHLLNAASRKLFEIPNLIELEQKNLQFRIDAYQCKVDELIKKQFSKSEIEKIVPAVGQDEIDASNAVVAGLKEELKALETFLADAPRFDVNLLKKTAIYPTNSTKAAA